jgi:hypothetical protein
VSCEISQLLCVLFFFWIFRIGSTLICIEIKALICIEIKGRQIHYK